MQVLSPGYICIEFTQCKHSEALIFVTQIYNKSNHSPIHRTLLIQGSF